MCSLIPKKGLECSFGTAGSQQMWFGHLASIWVPLEVFRSLIDPTLAGGMLYPVWQG